MLKLLLDQKNISQYRLEKLSHISHSTLSDIVNEKYDLNNCSVSIINKIAKALNMTMDEIYSFLSYDKLFNITFNREFDLFKSNVCHELKDLEYKEFLKKYLANDDIMHYYESKQYEKALYLLSMVDYLSIEHQLPLAVKYSKIRKKKLNKLVVPESVYILLKAKQIKFHDIFNEANPYFYQHNIVEADINNVI